MSKQYRQLPILTRLFSFYSLLLPVVAIFVLSLSPGITFAQSTSEEEIEGTLEVLHEDRDPGSRYVYFLRTAAERLELRFGADAPALQTGDRVRARGRRINGVLALSSSSSVETLTTALPNTFGAQKTIVMLVNFYDNATQPYAVSTAQSVFNTTSNFDLENSYAQTWMTGVANPAASADVYGWFTINQSSTVCDYNTTASLAEQAATAAGANLSQYGRRVYAFPSNACSWWGLGTVGGNPSRAWINGSLQLRVVGHEMGHNLGLYHSHSLDCGSAVIASSCTASEYGDTLDIMGASAYHYNAFQKERLGWLDYNVSPPITTVGADGIYWIAPYESNDPNPKALKILKSIDPSTGRKTYYYVEYRQPIGFDAALSTNSNVVNGVVLHIGTESSGNSNYLLDMTPATSSWADPALVVGQSYSDPDAGVTITVMSVSSSAANVSVTFGGGGGGTTTCVQANPTVTLSPSSQSVAVGSSATYTVTVANKDNSYCTASGFNLSAAVPSGFTASFGSSSLSVAPGSSASTTLQVGSSSSLAGGTYNFTVTGTNSAATSYSGSASGVENLIASVGVTATTDKSVYVRKDWVYMKASVTTGGSPVAGASVNFTLKKSNGGTSSGNATTDSTGTAVYKYRLKPNDPMGPYGVTAVGSVSNMTGTGTTSFTVQ